jgi:hypothetical protein
MTERHIEHVSHGIHFVLKGDIVHLDEEKIAMYQPNLTLCPKEHKYFR